MNQADAERWKSEVLDEIFAALAERKELDEALIFKGARVLNLRLNGGRQSLDIDSNLTAEFVTRYPDREDQRQFLEHEMKATIRIHFERQVPVRFELANLQVRTHPPKAHPMGWDAFEVRINLNDVTRRVRGLPALTIDVACPGEILESSVSRIEVGGHMVHAYTLERIAGQKLRTFLSSPPTYRTRANKPGESVRAKDLYDIALIHRHRNLSDEAFWQLAGREFRLACQSRCIDCAGLATFQGAWRVTRTTYAAATIPTDITFEETEKTLVEVVRRFESLGIIPFTFPIRAKQTVHGE